MKLATSCFCCGSNKLTKKLAYFVPFIAHCVMDYPLQTVTFNGNDIGYPFLLTNSLHCEVCDFVFSQARFDDGEMEKIYKDYRSKSYAELRNVFEPGYLQLNEHIGKSDLEKSNRRAAMFDFFSPDITFETIRSVLDYGGDAGQHIPDFFVNAAKFVYEVSGVAPVEGVNSITDLNHLKPVDLVMNCNVLEHLPDPKIPLQNIKHLFHKNTILFIDVPSERNSGSTHANYFHEHINLFNEKSISTLLKSEGFNILKIKTYLIDCGWCQAHSTFVLATPIWLI